MSAWTPAELDQVGSAPAVADRIDDAYRTRYAR
jgi:hypothetical protein